jgi:hypothetical protein
MPQEIDAEAGGALCDQLMKHSTPHSPSRSLMGKCRIDSESRAQKANAGERIRILRRH